MALLVLHHLQSGAFSAPVLRRFLRQTPHHPHSPVVVVSEVAHAWLDREAQAWIEAKRLVVLSDSTTSALGLADVVKSLLQAPPHHSQREQPLVFLPLLALPPASPLDWQTPWGPLLDGATQHLTTLQQSPFVTGHERIRLMPWLFCDQALALWPHALWECPLALSTGATTPLAYTATSTHGALREESWASERLFHDLHLIAQLSLRHESLEATFPRPAKDATRHAWTGYSVRAFLPWATEGKGHMLKQLQTQLEPASALDPTRLPESWESRIAERQDQHRALRQTLEISATHFHAAPPIERLRQSLSAKAEALGPHPELGPRRWPVWHGYAWSPYLRPYQSQAFIETIHQLLPEMASTLEQTALSELLPKFQTQLEAISEGLSEDLSLLLSEQSTHQQSLTRFLDTLDLYLKEQLRAFDLLTPQPVPSQSLTELLAPAMQRQSQREIELYQKARTIPAKGMRALEASTWAIGATLAWWGLSAPWDLRLGLSLAGLGALSTWLNHRQLTLHFGHIKRTEDAPESWLQWRAAWLEMWPELLQRVLDGILPQLQAHILQCLKHLHRQLELRLEFVQVQREGLKGFAQAEQFRLSQLRERHPHHPDLGLFQLHFPFGSHVVPMQTLTRQFASLWRPLSQLVSPPSPVDVAHYHQALQDLAALPQAGTTASLSLEAEPLASFWQHLHNPFYDSRLSGLSEVSGQWHKGQSRLLLALSPSLADFAPLFSGLSPNTEAQSLPFVEEDVLVLARYQLVSFYPTTLSPKGVPA